MGPFADSHKGIALCFEIPDETASDVLLGVDYTKDRARIEFDPDARSVVGGKDTVNMLLKTKFEDWKYEEEYRFFIDLESSQKEGSNYFENFSDKLALSDVILGFKCDFRIEQIRELIGSNYANVRVLKAGLHQQLFEVVED